MPHSTRSSTKHSEKPAKRLVLCFDGTGNTFSGNTSDTNIVKIYNKLDRDDDNQFHYYQTGIGTYDINGGSVNKGFFGSVASNVSRTIDEGFGTSFDAHVIAGYRFVMRYYGQGDKIYMFGFSRGAFTARFLARMINTVGLLSKGNEEMVPFAYAIYQEYEQGKIELEAAKGTTPDTAASANGATKTASLSYGGPKTPLLDGKPCSEDHDHAKDPVVDNLQRAQNKLEAFKSTFCRRDKIYADDGTTVAGYSPIRVYFLGIFDCVNSVAVLDSAVGKIPRPVSVLGTAEHVRHAVALDERRVKFKAALLAQDQKHKDHKADDIKEVWFPGNHGDVGGGWPAPKPEEKQEKKSIWQRFRRFWFKQEDKNASKVVSDDPYQMSDVALSWMIRELELVGKKEPQYKLAWSDHLRGFKANFTAKKDQALDAAAHDTMRFKGGSTPFKVLLWNFMEYLPFLARWELDNGNKWVYEWWRPNRGLTRDIPAGAVFHNSVISRLSHPIHKYAPKNNSGGNQKPVLLGAQFKEYEVDEDHEDGAHHTTYVLAEPSANGKANGKINGAAR